MGTIASRVEQLLDTAVVSTTPVAGGDICTATRLRLSDGRNALVKTRPHAPKGFFTTEADGLRWLAEAGGAPVPAVYAADSACLILEWVEPGRATAESAEQFGRDLAATHDAGADIFGADHDGFIGTAPLPNRESPSWVEFYATRRVLPYLKAAHDRKHISDPDAATVDAFLHRLADVSGEPAAPARIHGDLWSGNLVWGADGRTYLIDPAAHGGHRETDLAMLTLFGTPHLTRIQDAYAETTGLDDGWRDRIPVHQVHPLLVHATLFGGSYGRRAAAAARSALELAG